MEMDSTGITESIFVLDGTRTSLKFFICLRLNNWLMATNFIYGQLANLKFVFIDVLKLPPFFTFWD